MVDDALRAALLGIVGPSGLIDEADDIAPYLTDWRGAFVGHSPFVVRPGNVNEVVAVVNLLRELGRPIVAQGGNTGLCGGATPDDSGREIIVSLGRMAHIRSIDPADNLLVAEAGCVLADVQRAAEDVGRLFPLSLGAEGTAQLGGLVSTNAGGTAVLRYGMTRDLVLGIEAVLPNGEIWHGLRGLRKDNTGYDLKHLFIGAEGTLGLVTAVTLKLFPRPRETVTALVSVPDTDAAVKLLRHLQNDAGDNVVTFEFIGQTAFEMLLAQCPQLQSPFGHIPAACVLVEVASYWRDFAARDAVENSLLHAAEAGLAGDAVMAANPTQAAALWRLRESIPEAEKRAGASVKHDVSVTPGRIPNFLAEVGRQIAAEYPDAELVVFGHLGDGSLHLNVAFPEMGRAPVPADLQAKVWRLVHDIVAAYNGSISAEHGIGKLKRDELWHYRSAVDRRLMTGIKTLLDPKRIMNPGKVV